MICIPVIDTWRSTIWSACRFLFDECIAKPVRGLIEMAKGLMLSVPDLADALTQAIASKLSADGRARVQRGFEHIATGWMLARVPLLVLVLIVAYGWQGLLFAISIGSLLVMEV